jgi:RHS repeat-associated protein
MYRGQTTYWVWDGNNPLHEWVEGRLERLPDEAVPFAGSDDAIVKKRDAELEALLAQGPPSRGEKAAPITWLFEAESFAPMAKLVGSDQFSIVTDHLGTPVLMADADGRTQWSAATSAYGELRDVTGDRHACPFRWPGQYEDAETGLYYNRFRYYDAESGQYTSQDPIRLGAGTRLLGYAKDPTTAIDPWGLSACVPKDPRIQKAIASGRPIVIVGRGMSRVHPVADAIRAAGGNVKTYTPKNFRSTPGNVNRLDVEANREWLRYWAKDKDALVVDIGHIPGAASNRSPFYDVERRSLYDNWSGTDIVQHDPGF